MIMKLLRIAIIFLFFGILSCSTVEDGGGATPVDETQKFLGKWNVSDQPARLNYVVEITKRPGYDNEIILDNFADLGSQATGLVVKNNIIIDQQSLGGPYSTEGTGLFINANKLEIDFFLDDGIDKEARKSIYTK